MHIFAAEKATFLWGCRGNGEFSVFGHSMNINPFTAITINTNCMTWATASRKCPSQKKVPCLVPKFSHKGCTYLEIEVFDCFFPSRNYIYICIIIHINMCQFQNHWQGRYTFGNWKYLKKCRYSVILHFWGPLLPSQGLNITITMSMFNQPKHQHCPHRR